MIRGHYDEEELVELFERGEQAVARDPHVRACAACKETIESIALFADTLKSPDVWEGPELSPDPNPQVLATLRAAQQRMRSEDEEAEENIKQLLAGPRESWSPRLQEHPEWRTAGMVRKLIAATDRAIDSCAPEAADLAAILLDVGRDSDAVTRSLALFEQAYASTHAGRYVDALTYLERAECEIASAPARGYIGARIDVLRSNASRVLDRLDEAIARAKSAAATFKQHGDRARYLAARSVLAVVYQNAGRHRDAVMLQEEIASDGACSPEWRAAALQNAAASYRELGDLERATSFAGRAIAAYEQLQIFSLAAKARWTLARVFTAQNRDDEALHLLNIVRDEFSTAGMSNDVALVSLDIAEILLRRNRTTEVLELCRMALSYLTSAQLSATPAAMAALATLHEASLRGRVTLREVVVARENLTRRLKLEQLQLSPR